jgi:hypothetical protein
MKTYRSSGGIAPRTRHQMEVCGQLHAPATLLPRKEPPPPVPPEWASDSNRYTSCDERSFSASRAMSYVSTLHRNFRWYKSENENVHYFPFVHETDI